MSTGLVQVDTDGGTVRTADTQYFPASTAMSASLVHFQPGGLRQMHWHVNEDEWQFMLNGTVEVGFKLLLYLLPFPHALCLADLPAEAHTQFFAVSACKHVLWSGRLIQ